MYIEAKACTFPFPYPLSLVLNSFQSEKGGSYFTMDQNQSLYIPLGVKPEAEWFPGFGQHQLGQSAIGSLAAVVVALCLWLMDGSVPLAVVTFLIGVSASVMMTTKDRHNLSVLDQIMFMIRYAKSQKFYPYRSLNTWTTTEYKL